MAGTPKGITSAAAPWARSVESRLEGIDRALKRFGVSMAGLPDADKTVFAEYDYGQNIGPGVLGRVEPSSPVAVQYVSSTGLFEVTVSLAGMVRDGAIFGASFENDENTYEVQYDIPKHGVVASAPTAQTAWSPFGSSYSTVIATRPGTQRLALYLYANTTTGANGAAYLERARLSVKAV